ncbi:hypothetical protein [Candidatus Similichlamydia laticola]|uniref:Uncharacterized protein n=1 Tax=Candidatus Similichlamydia laticola TaxID=2170265 RepID=A0A369KCN0_9BACT|nr:hypothetical protein [Candidatus Similichlamydia laticola]RDB31210.1 hypothetical protein HAT2_00690 [Candidatus Similichlamydia laticola]
MSSLLHGVSSVSFSSSWSNAFSTGSQSSLWLDLHAVFSRHANQFLNWATFSLPGQAEEAGSILGNISFRGVACQLIQTAQCLAPALLKFGMGLSKFVLETTALMVVIVCVFVLFYFLASWICCFVEILIKVCSLAFNIIFGFLFAGSQPPEQKTPDTPPGETTLILAHRRPQN